MNGFTVDWSILNALQKIHCKPFDYILSFFSTLGDAGIFFIVCAILLICIKKTRVTGINAGMAVFTSFLIGNLAIKNIVRRPRPCWIDTSLDPFVRVPSDYSFPSGHTLISFTFATVIFMYNKKWGIISYILATIIGLSRIYFAVHFPTDVLAGMLLGIIVGILTSIFVQKILLNKKSS